MVSAGNLGDELLRPLRHHSPDAPLILALPHVMRFHKLLREEARVIDPAAVDVADVNRAIRPRGKIHGAAPFIAAAEKLRAFAHTRGLQARTIRLHLVPRDQLTRGIRHKHIVPQLRHQRPAIHPQPGARGVRPRMRIRRGVRDLQWEHARLGTERSDVLVVLRDARMRIARHGLVGHDGEHQRIAVRAVEVVAVVVERAAILALAAGDRDLIRARIPFEIAAGNVHHVLRFVGGIDLTRIQSVVEMHTAVQPPARRAHLKLRMLRIEALDERPRLVRLAIAVRVLEKENLRACGGDQPAVIRQQSLHVVHVIRKGHRLVHAPVAIFIGEQLNAREPRIARIRRPQRVVAHVRDIHAALRIPRAFHRIKHQRFRGDDLHFIVAIELDALHRLLG